MEIKSEENMAEILTTSGQPALNTGFVLDWEALDWTLNDVELAEQTGRTRERVRQKRKDLNKPKVARRIVSRSAQEKVASRLDQIKSLSRIEAAQIVGVAPSTLDKYRRVYNVDIRDGRFKLAHTHWNFSLPNADLERIWDLKKNSAANTRSRLRKGPPDWNIQRGSIPSDPEYHKAVKSEEKKAKRYYSKYQVDTDVIGEG